MEIIECDQLSDYWFEHRIGAIGGSTIAAVCAKGKGKMRKDLLYRKAGEILSGQSYHGFHNKNMDRGIELEPKARQAYTFFTGNAVRQVGLIKKSDYKIVSPDGLVEPNGSIEIKCVIPSVHVETIDHDTIPSAYRKQVQWTLFIGQLKWCDFVSFCPEIEDYPLHVIRTIRDDDLIKELDKEADRFIKELKALVEKIRTFAQ